MPRNRRKPKKHRIEEAAASGGQGAKTVKVPVQSVLPLYEYDPRSRPRGEFAKGGKEIRNYFCRGSETVKFVRKFLTKNELHASMARKRGRSLPGRSVRL